MTSRIIGRGIAALPIAWEDRPPTVTGLCRAPEVPRPHPRRAVGRNAPSRPRKLRTLRAFGRPVRAAVDGEALYGTTWARAPSPTPALRLLCPRHGTAVAVPSCHCPGRLHASPKGCPHAGYVLCKSRLTQRPARVDGEPGVSPPVSARLAPQTRGAHGRQRQSSKRTRPLRLGGFRNAAAYLR